MKVICLQIEPPAPGESAAERLEAVADQVGGQRDADLIVLPELWLTGYFAFDQYADRAEPATGPTLERLSEAAVAAGSHLAGGSIVERGPGGRLFNTQTLFDPAGSVVATYRKIHTFGYGSHEADLITGGEEVVVAETTLGRIGLSTCYDLRFPELYRGLVNAGAEILVVVASWPWSRCDHWDLLTRARALESQAWLIACDAAGTDRGTKLAGHSRVIAPAGDIAAEAGRDPGVLECTVDKGAAAAYRKEFPALADRRLSASQSQLSNRQTAAKEVECAPATSM